MLSLLYHQVEGALIEVGKFIYVCLVYIGINVISDPLKITGSFCISEIFCCIDTAPIQCLSSHLSMTNLVVYSCFNKKQTPYKYSQGSALTMLDCIYCCQWSGNMGKGDMGNTHLSVSMGVFFFFSFFRISSDSPYLLKDPVLMTIAKKHNRTPGQVALRYQLQRGVVVLAKSFNEKRIKENFEVKPKIISSV